MRNADFWNGGEWGNPSHPIPGRYWCVTYRLGLCRPRFTGDRFPPRWGTARPPAPQPLLRARRSPAAPPSLQNHRFASVRPQEIKIYRAWAAAHLETPGWGVLKLFFFAFPTAGRRGSAAEILQVQRSLSRGALPIRRGGEAALLPSPPPGIYPDKGPATQPRLHPGEIRPGAGGCPRPTLRPRSPGSLAAAPSPRGRRGSGGGGGSARLHHVGSVRSGAEEGTATSASPAPRGPPGSSPRAWGRCPRPWGAASLARGAWGGRGGGGKARRGGGAAVPAGEPGRRGGESPPPPAARLRLPARTGAPGSLLLLLVPPPFPSSPPSLPGSPRLREERGGPPLPSLPPSFSHPPRRGEAGEDPAASPLPRPAGEAAAMAAAALAEALGPGRPPPASLRRAAPAAAPPVWGEGGRGGVPHPRPLPLQKVSQQLSSGPEPPPEGSGGGGRAGGREPRRPAPPGAGLGWRRGAGGGEVSLWGEAFPLPPPPTAAGLPPPPLSAWLPPSPGGCSFTGGGGGGGGGVHRPGRCWASAGPGSAAGRREPSAGTAGPGPEDVKGRNSGNWFASRL